MINIFLSRLLFQIKENWFRQWQYWYKQEENRAASFFVLCRLVLMSILNIITTMKQFALLFGNSLLFSNLEGRISDFLPCI